MKSRALLDAMDTFLNHLSKIRGFYMLPEASTQDWGQGAQAQWGLLVSTLSAITGMYV